MIFEIMKMYHILTMILTKLIDSIDPTEADHKCNNYPDVKQKKLTVRIIVIINRD